MSSFCNSASSAFRFARPYPCAQVCLSGRRRRWSTQGSSHGGTWRASISFAIGQGTASCASSQSENVVRQRGNGIVDSVPSGSGNHDVQLRRQRLLFAQLFRCRSVPPIPTIAPRPPGVVAQVWDTSGFHGLTQKPWPMQNHPNQTVPTARAVPVSSNPP